MNVQVTRTFNTTFHNSAFLPRLPKFIEAEGFNKKITMDPWQQFLEQRELLSNVKIDGKWLRQKQKHFTCKNCQPSAKLTGGTNPGWILTASTASQSTSAKSLSFFNSSKLSSRFLGSCWRSCEDNKTLLLTLFSQV